MKNGSWHWFGLRLWLDAIFWLLLPLASRLPMRWGMVLAVLLGKFCRWLDVDWRTVALREHYVAQRTRLAYREICPTLSDRELDGAVARRFENSSREELEGHWFALGRTGEVACKFEGVTAIHDYQQQGKGAVLLTLHFDATLMGVVKLGEAGLRLNLMTSDVVEDRRVARSVQRYFARKYAGIDKALNGGRALHVESHLKTFYSGIRSGEGVVVLGEAPTGNVEEALLVDFLGRRRAIAPGAVRIAEKTGAPMAAFVCLREAVGSYRVLCSPLVFPEKTAGHSQNVQFLFDFLAAHVRQMPDRWWAADQLPNFINVD